MSRKQVTPALVIGNSHAQCLVTAAADPRCPLPADGLVSVFDDYGSPDFAADFRKEILATRAGMLKRSQDAHRVDTLLCIAGNHHNTVAMRMGSELTDFILPSEPDLPLEKNATIVPYSAVYQSIYNLSLVAFSSLVDLIRNACDGPLIHLYPPAPIEDEDLIRKLQREHAERSGVDFGTRPLDNVSLSPPLVRYKAWCIGKAVIRDLCDSYGIYVTGGPDNLTTEDGRFLFEGGHSDATHGGEEYARRVWQWWAEVADTERARAAKWLASRESLESPTRSPYDTAPDRAYWRRSAQQPPGLVDPVGPQEPLITKETRIATAGSCFAQHIARYLANSGYRYMVTEGKPSYVSTAVAESFNYGTFTARYGNIYTARQLRQLIERAKGTFDPIEDAWELPEGGWVDPFRTQIQPGGFASVEELRQDRAAHFRSVLMAIGLMDVLVFTLGLTEGWRDRRDGSIYPVAPGVSGGSFDPSIHEFVNFGVDEVREDLNASLDLIATVNPAAKVILTVSPVPLIATATEQSVVTATTYSKSVLRVAADELSGSRENVIYFPSYEVITSPLARGRYFAEDLRSVREVGVAHVMTLFFRHLANHELELPEELRRYLELPEVIDLDLDSLSAREPEPEEDPDGYDAISRVLCDLDALQGD